MCLRRVLAGGGLASEVVDWMTVCVFTWVTGCSRKGEFLGER